MLVHIHIEGYKRAGVTGQGRRHFMKEQSRQDYKKYFMQDRKKGFFGHRGRLAAFLICLVAVLGAVGIRQGILPVSYHLLDHPKVQDNRSVKKTQSDFDALIQQIFRDEVTSDSFTLNYTLKAKENYGITQEKPTLGEYSLKEMKNSLVVSENRVAMLETYDYEKLTKEQKLIYDTIYLLSKQNLEAADFLEYTECLGPTTGIQTQLPVYFAEYSLRSKNDVDTYLELLNLVPAYFKEILSFEQMKAKKGIFMSETTAQAIIDQCNDFVSKTEQNYLITIFAGKLLSVADMTDTEKSTYEQKNKELVLNAVIPAYKNLAEGLKELIGSSKNQKGLCYLEKGKEYYSYLVKAKTGSDRSIKEIEHILDNKIEELKKKIAKVISDTPDVYYQAQKVEYTYNTPQTAMEHLKKAIQKDFPALDESIGYELKYVDASLEESMSPAFYLTPAIDDYKNNVIYINRNKRYDLSKAFTTIGHEGYPGHLYQTCYFQSQNPSPLRSMINVAGYTEGWGTYAELYGYDLAGLKKDVAKLLKENTLITLCLYAKADIGIHYKGWDQKKLQRYLTDFGFSKSNMMAIYQSLLAEPASYMPYTIGYLEIDDLLNDAKKQLGRKFVLKDFHKFFLSLGPVPFTVAKDRMQGWIEMQLRQK
ncbi:MAG: DUF885 domain-containing protein [Clostridiaceae bacterium]|nr:MAG: DUF885 domain-containing protein [Clostridiaceae bacterium]